MSSKKWSSQASGWKDEETLVRNQYISLFKGFLEKKQSMNFLAFWIWSYVKYTTKEFMTSVYDFIITKNVCILFYCFSLIIIVHVILCYHTVMDHIIIYLNVSCSEMSSIMIQDGMVYYPNAWYGIISYGFV